MGRKKYGIKPKTRIERCIEITRFVQEVRCGLAVATFALTRTKKISECHLQVAQDGLYTARGRLDHIKKHYGSFAPQIKKVRTGASRAANLVGKAKRRISARDRDKARDAVANAEVALDGMIDAAKNMCKGVQ